MIVVCVVVVGDIRLVRQRRRREDGRDRAKLVDGQVDRLFEVAISDWDVSVRRKDNLEGLVVGRRDSLECGNNGRCCEDSDVVNRDNEGSNVSAANVAYAGRGGVRDNA